MKSGQQQKDPQPIQAAHCSNLRLRLEREVDDVSAVPLTEGRFRGERGDFWTENSVVNQ